jgi:uroporphyrinogen-III synthase
MSEYVIEIIRGRDRVFLSRKESGRANVTPQERNAVTFTSPTDAKTVIDALMEKSPADIRKLVKVDAGWEQPIQLLARKRLGSSHMTTNARLYLFKEAA